MNGRALVLAFLAVGLGSLTYSCRQRRDVSEPKATPEDRKVIGAAAVFAHDREAGDGDEAKLKTFAGRREVAWRMVERLLAPARIGTAGGLETFRPDAEASLPLWQTWYDSGEFVEIFKRLYTGLGKEGRQAKKPFCPKDIRDVHAVHATKSLKGWTPQKLEQRLGQLKSQEDVRGVSGKGVTLFSPGAVDGLLANYGTILKCPDVQKAVTRTTPPPTGKNFSACMDREFPAGDERAVPVEAAAYSHCGDVDVSAPKFDYGMDGVAVAVKTAWNVAHRDELGAFDTSGPAIEAMMKSGEWAQAKLIKDADLNPGNIYTIKLQPSLREYWLSGIHFAAKTTRHWLWISLWWSDEPDTDFGADRPESLKRMGPWGNYKMCVVSDYNESDPDPAASFEKLHPSLAAAVKGGAARYPSATWCSNPYIELGKGNARTNCIGCHQHAGTAEAPDEVFTDDPADQANAARRAKYPNDGRSQVRSSFPADYLWSMTQSPDFFATKMRGKVYEMDLSDK